MEELISLKMDHFNERMKKHCEVCGDKAIGFNFNGLSCESCKAFFRRNAVKQKQLICRKENKCTVDKSNRKYCKKCRLRKCYEIGMKKELIWCYKKNVIPKQGPENWNLSPKPEGSHLNLSSAELESLSEVQNALSVFVDEEKLPLVGNVLTVVQAVNLPGLYIKRVVKFCKNISAFKCLGVDDQLIVLKGFFTEILVTRFAFSYNLAQDGFRVMQNESGENAIFIPMEILKELKNKDFAQIYRRFVYALQLEMENDVNIRDLIIAQYLFSPRDGISCPEYIRYHYHIYCRLLHRYLDQRYQSAYTANTKYDSIMNVIKQFADVKRIIRQIFTDLDSSQVIRVINELFSLNSNN